MGGVWLSSISPWVAAARAVLTPCLPVWTASAGTIIRMKDQRHRMQSVMNSGADNAIPPGTDAERMTIMDVKRSDTNGHDDGRIEGCKPSQPYPYHVT